MSTGNETKSKAAKVSPEKVETATPSEAPSQAESKLVEVWPLRSYQDQGEIKRRGGPGYAVPKRHADQLITARLATDKPPQA